MPRRPQRDDRGQATVELALVFPVILLLLLLLIQVGFVVRAHILTTHAAREGARVAAVGEDPMAAAVASSGLDPRRMDVERSGGDAPGETVTITIEYDAPTDVPIVGRLLDDVEVRAEATMRIEG
ncbi:MAG: TadE family protein [Actinomycetota bacterium]